MISRLWGNRVLSKSFGLVPLKFFEVIKGLKNEGLVKVVGERDKRMIRRME
jgi:hypothetical protein